MQVKRLAVGGSHINLEVAGVNYNSHRSADGQRHAINRTMGYADKFDFEWPNFQLASRDYLAQVCLVEQAMLLKTLVYQRQCEARAINGSAEVAQDVGKGADVVFMAMGEQDSAQVLLLLFQISDIGDDDVHAKEFGLREHHAGVNENHVVP